MQLPPPCLGLSGCFVWPHTTALVTWVHCSLVFSYCAVSLHGTNPHGLCMWGLLPSLQEKGPTVCGDANAPADAMQIVAAKKQRELGNN